MGQKSRKNPIRILAVKCNFFIKQIIQRKIEELNK
jgi:hypothetical protein